MSGNFPNINELISPSSIEWELEQNSFVFTSFTNVSQAVPIPNARWRGSMLFDIVDQGELIDLELFIDQLEGRAGRFCVFNPAYPTYPEVGTPNVNQAMQTGKLLTVQGWLPNRLVMRKGQFFNIGNELKRCVADTYSDATGLAALRFYPPIRVTPALNAPINTSSPFMLASLDRDSNPTSTDENLNSDIRLNFTEAIYDR